MINTQKNKKLKTKIETKKIKKIKNEEIKKNQTNNSKN